MIFTNVVLLATAAVASAAGNRFKRDGELVFPIATIPSSCDDACAIYKDVFNTCPENSGAAICGGVCNGTTLTELQVCINCTLIEGLAEGKMTQFNVDVLNGAQQQLAQSCVEDQFPAVYTGKVPNPNTVAYPSGVDKATYVSNSTAVPTASATKAANASSSAASSSVSVSVSGEIAAPAVTSGKLSGASALSVSAGLVAFVAAGAALL